MLNHACKVCGVWQIISDANNWPAPLKTRPTLCQCPDQSEYGVQGRSRLVVVIHLSLNAVSFLPALLPTKEMFFMHRNHGDVELGIASFGFKSGGAMWQHRTCQLQWKNSSLQSWVAYVGRTCGLVIESFMNVTTKWWWHVWGKGPADARDWCICCEFVEAFSQCHMYPVYINAHANHIADDLSCDNMSTFFPQASPITQWIPPILTRLLLGPNAEWICLQWRHRCADIFIRA